MEPSQEVAARQRQGPDHAYWIAYAQKVEGDREYLVWLGCYSSRARARDARRRFRAAHPDWIRGSVYEAGLDEEQWEDGFVTIWTGGE